LKLKARSAARRSVYPGKRLIPQWPVRLASTRQTCYFAPFFEPVQSHGCWDKAWLPFRPNRQLHISDGLHANNQKLPFASVHDRRKAIGPIKTTAREQADAIGVTLRTGDS